MNVTDINASKNKFGAEFSDGSIMLSRRGCSNTVQGGVGGVSIEVTASHDLSHICNLRYTDGSNGPVHERRGRYFMEPPKDSDSALYPVTLVNDLLNFIELHTGKRPTKLRQQVHAYMFGNNQYPYQETDIIISPFRYDTSTSSIFFIEGDVQVANLDQAVVDRIPVPFNTSTVTIQAQNELCVTALAEAMRVGFHQCDLKYGAHYCMKRLAWLAGCFYESAMNGTVMRGFVLKSDMETPATLVE